MPPDATAPRERPILLSGPAVLAVLNGQKTEFRRPVKNLRVQLRHQVASDLPDTMPRFGAEPGEYGAEMNQHGAVSVRTASERLLGVKPQEFDFLCPYADGHTYLRKHPDGRCVWTLQTSGSRLWVRETLRLRPERGAWVYDGDGAPVIVRCGDDEAVLAMRTWAHHKEGEVCASTHLPRWASRLTLEVTDVHLERVQAISEEQSRREGASDQLPSEGRANDIAMSAWCRYTRITDPKSGHGTQRGAFAYLWDREHGRDGEFGWRANPWCWVISFRRAEVRRAA